MPLKYKLLTNRSNTMYYQITSVCVMSHQFLSRQAKSKYESPTAVGFGSKTPKSDHGSSENV